MSLAITVNAADYSNTSIGWEAPTSVQPECALFALDNASGMKNLSASGLQPSPIGNSPTFTPGVSGQSFPFVTLGYGQALQTYAPLSASSTVVSLINVGEGNTNIFSPYNSPSPALFYAQRGTTSNNYLADGNDNITANATTTVFDTWQIATWQYDMSTTTVTLGYYNYTTNLSVSANSTFSKVYSPAGTYAIGQSADTAVEMMFKGAIFLIWNSILDSDDMTKAVAWVRKYAASYNVTV